MKDGGEIAALEAGDVLFPQLIAWLEENIPSPRDQVQFLSFVTACYAVKNGVDREWFFDDLTESYEAAMLGGNHPLVKAAEMVFRSASDEPTSPSS